MEKAFDLFNAGEYEAALGLFEKALETEPKENWSAVHSNVGAVLMAMGDLPSAVAAFDDALKLEPDNADSLLNKGIALNEIAAAGDGQAHYADALACFERVCALTSASAQQHAALCGRSQALAGLLRFDEAAEVADLACKLDPSIALGFQDKAFALLKGRRFHEANAVYETALVLSAEDPDETKRLFSIALVQEALDLEMGGERDQALTLLHRANALHPEPQALLNEGLILLLNKRDDEGVRCMKQSIEMDSDYFEPHNALGTWYATQNKFPESMQYLTRACEIDPNAIEPLFNRGFVRLKGSYDVPGARKDWLQVLVICPGEPHATEALRLLDEALRLAKERNSDGKKELDEAIQAIERFTNCAPEQQPEAKLVLDEDGNVLGLTPQETEQVIAALDRLQDPSMRDAAALEQACKDAANKALLAAEDANKAADACKGADDAEASGDAALKAALRAANMAGATSPIAFAGADAAPDAALDAAIAATKSADAGINAAEQALIADPIANAHLAQQAAKAALDALQNADRAITKAGQRAAAANDAALGEKAKQAAAAVAAAVQRGKALDKKCAAAKQNPSYADVRDALRKHNRGNGESSLDRLARGNNGINAVPFGQGLLKKTGRLEALLGQQPPVFIADNDGKLIGMTKSEGDAVLATMDALPATKTVEERIKLAQALPEQLNSLAKDTARATKDAASAGSGKLAQSERAALLASKAANLGALALQQALALSSGKPSTPAAAAAAQLDLLESAVDATVAATAAAEQIIKTDPLKSDFALGIAASAMATAKAASEECARIIANNQDANSVARANRILANAKRAMDQANNATRDATAMKGSAAYLDALSKLRKVGDDHHSFAARQSNAKAVPFGQFQLRSTGRKLTGRDLKAELGGGGGSIEAMLANSVARDRGKFDSRYEQTGSIGTPYRAAPAVARVIYKKAGPPPEGVQYPFADLKSPKCPEGVDPANKEEYLTADEFKKLFGKTHEEFKALPAWRRAREKQQKGIF